MCQTKNEARNKLDKQGHIHILSNFNTLVLIVQKLFKNKVFFHLAIAVLLHALLWLIVVYKNTLVFECNVVSKFQSNR